MSGYIEVGAPADAQQIAIDILRFLSDRYPGWVPAEADFTTVLAMAFGAAAEQVNNTARLVPDAIFRTFGRSIMNVQPINAGYATAGSTWTMVDTQGYTIPQGTTVGYRIAGDELVPFQTIAPLVITPGNIAGSVQIRALTPGTVANDIPAANLTVIDAFNFVASVAGSITAGGVDAEDDATYLNRLSDEMSLSSPRPILPADFAILAKRVVGVARAVAIDGYDPANGTTNNERMVTVAVVDVAGHAVPTPVLNDVSNYLESLREVNYIVNVINPTFVSINVDATVKVLAAYDPIGVAAAVRVALQSYLASASWGGGDENPPVWHSDSTKVRMFEVARQIDNVEGVEYIKVLTINGGTADIPLTGYATLTLPGNINVTGAVV